MNGPKLSKTQRAKLKADIMEMHIKGYEQTQIAERLNITQPLVSYYLKQLRTEWSAQAIRDKGAEIVKQLTEIRLLRREYYEAWQKSKDEKQISTTAKETEGAQAGETQVVGRTKSKAQLRREQQIGNPSYLAGVQWCLEREAALLGLDAPKKYAVEDLDAMIEREHALLAGKPLEDAPTVTDSIQ